MVSVGTVSLIEVRRSGRVRSGEVSCDDGGDDKGARPSACLVSCQDSYPSVHLAWCLGWFSDPLLWCLVCGVSMGYFLWGV